MDLGWLDLAGRELFRSPAPGDRLLTRAAFGMALRLVGHHVRIGAPASVARPVGTAFAACGIEVHIPPPLL